jgi:hypothetical protein
MKQWQISELEQKEMEDVNYKKLLFHFYNAQADRIEKWFEKIGLNHISRFEDCRTNHFFYVENCDLQYVNTDSEEEIIYLLDEGFELIEITADEVKGMTLQEYTDKLQELCHNGLAQKKVVLYFTVKGETFMNNFPMIKEVTHVVAEDSVGINLGDYGDYNG